MVKGSHCSLDRCAQVQQSPSIVVNDDVVHMRADGYKLSLAVAHSGWLAARFQLTAEHDVNDASETVAVEEERNMAPPWRGEHHQSQARPTKGHVEYSNVWFINVIEAKDREERAKGREREQGQAQRGEGEEACVVEGVGHGRVRFVGE